MTPPRGCARGRHGRGQVDSALLSLTCASLGAAGYVKGDHCLDNLKELQRLLRRDDPERWEVFKQVCKWKIASRDLVPIIENYQADRNLVITAGSRHAVLLFVRCWSAPRDALCALVDVVCHQLRRSTASPPEKKLADSKLL